MKSKLYLFILFFSMLSFGQQTNTITLHWTDNVKATVAEKPLTIPQFQAEYLDFDAASGQLFFRYSFPVSSTVNENSLKITNVVYETITREQLGDIQINSLPVKLNETLKQSSARDKIFAILRLSPIIKENNTYKRIKSFSYSFENSSSGYRTFNSTLPVTNSVLATGEWHRFYVEKSGVYKITRSFLQQLGVNVNANPQNIKIFGSGGRMVPLLNSTPYPDDLQENAITFIGEEDGVFNDSDYILLYAEGMDNWSPENGTHNNLYADRAYYYITTQGGAGKRINQALQPGGAPATVTTTFDEYHYHEKDLVNIARLGRKWHGEQFNVNNEQNFEFNIPDLDTSQPVTLSVSAAATAVSTTSMAVKANNQTMGTISFSAPGTYDAARDGFYTGTFTPAGGIITVSLTYNNNGIPGSNAYLDYITLKSKRRLRGNGSQFRFTYEAAANNIGVIEYRFTDAQGISEVWDVTDIYNVVKYVNSSQSQFSFKANMGEARRYITVVPNNYFTPLRESQSRVANQNLKGSVFRNAQGQFQDIDYVIITPAFLNGPAQKLANFHRNHSQLNVKVIHLENIYHEFSSGKQDIGGIRNFIKYIYNRASSPEKRIKYLNLFGDASFDFKNRIPNNTNIVPILHAFDSGMLGGGSGIPNYSIVQTFVSDDFFGLMDDNEGRMLASDSEGLDIAVGRMLVSTVKQAEEMVNKVIEYSSENAYGRWRNEYVLVSDDVDQNDQAIQANQEQLAETLSENKPFVNVRKIHSDAFVQQASAGGNRYPEVRQLIISSINNGALVVNYLGHGGEDGWAHERIFEKTDAQTLNNRYKYPLFITATCEFTKFDNPYRPTAGEYVYWNPTGGAIAMITTTRSIFTSVAFSFNHALSAKLYAFDGGEYPSMAEAMRLTKSTLSDNYARVVSFVGDPAIKLSIPKPKIVLTQVNGIPVPAPAEILKSLSHVKLTGQVTDENGNLLNNYNGELAVAVFDKKIERTTLDNDNRGITMDFSTLGETIFRGNASVNNGNFEFGFVVPRDIRIPVGDGRVSFYAKRGQVLEDQTGYDNTIKVGGINENAAADNLPPRVKLFMNDETFISGGITNASPILLAFLEDENGINTASGIGHDIIAILDGDETNPYILNDYYETELDDYTKGIVRFPFKNLEKGLHTLTFKAWDVYNNPVTAEIQFIVTGDDVLELERVLNYPNPFVSYTEFWFTHNRPFEPLDVQVQVFTVSGKVVKTINQTVLTEGFLCRDVRWDGRDDFGDRIGKGVYVYKLTVKSTLSGKKSEKYEKLVLL